MKVFSKEKVFSWLKRNGEAIYKTKPWIHQNDTITSDVWYTSSNKVHKHLDPVTNQSVSTQVVYAIILKYPFETSFVELGSLHQIFDEKIPIELIGYPHKIEVILNRSSNFMKKKLTNFCQNLVDKDETKHHH